MTFSNPSMNAGVTLSDIKEAAERLKGQAVLTPLLNSPALDERVGGRVFLKPENLQRTGSFKFRGAYNKISQIPEDARKRGVVAYSSGNHAQGVALAAKLRGVPAVIIMPSDAPSIKMENTRGYGAEIIEYDRFNEPRDVIADAVQKERGSYLVSPYDDPLVVAGQGTCGLEMAEQCRALGVMPDAVLTCCGGGGLTAGVAIAVKSLLPETSVHLVEPEGFDDTGRSLRTGERVKNEVGNRSICDALLSPIPGVLTFPLNLKYVDSGLAVDDDAVRSAMAFAFNSLKLVVEPGGAVTLAALLSGRFDARGKTVVATISGGNVDWEQMEKALRSAARN